MGFFVAIIAAVAFTTVLFIAVHWFLKGKRTDTTTIFAQQMALRIGTLHALIIALVFGAIASEYLELEESLDIEAAYIASLYTALNPIKIEVTEDVQEKVMIYLENIIKIEWKHVSKRPLSESGGQILADILRILQNWDASLPYEVKIKNYAVDLVFKINELRIRRLYAWYRDEIPTTFWIIAVLGFFLTLVPYLTVELSKRRLFLINCYASMIGITFYGILVLNKPFIYGLVAPTPYKMIYEEINPSPLPNNISLNNDLSTL